MKVDPFNGSPINKKFTEADVEQLLDNPELLDKLRQALNVNSGGGTSVAPVSGGISIGDTIGGTPANGGVLYADSSDALKADLWTVGSSSYFAGAVVGKTLGVQGITDSPRLEALDLSGFAQPNAVAVTGSTGTFQFGVIDTAALSQKFRVVVDTANSTNNTLAFATGGIGTSTAEFEVTATQTTSDNPIDMNSHKITELSDGTASTDAANLGQVDAKVSDTAYGSGWNGVTTIAPSKNAVYDKIESLGSGTPGGSNTQVQYNDSGVLGGESTFTYDETNNRLTVTGGYRMSAGSSYYIGDTDGNGKIWFDGNAANIYGYGMISFRDGSGEYLNMTRTRFTHGSRGPNNDPLGGGNYDAGAQLNEDVPAYAGKGFGSVIAPRVTATANNDIIAAQYVNPEMRELSYTGVKKIAQIIAPHNSGTNTIRQRLYAASSQSVDMTQWVDSSAAVMSAIAKNGAFKPASLADSAAENGTVYYSTDASKLVYKDSGGTVNNLY